MPDYIPFSRIKNKSNAQKNLINEALHILDSLGVPLEDTPRRLERMALAFLAVADVKSSDQWADIKDITSGRSLKTRDIIDYENEHFNENISSGSYDDIRRKDLKLSVLARVVVRTDPESARNSPTRGYAIDSEVADLIRKYNTDAWDEVINSYMSTHDSLKDYLAGIRDIAKIPVQIPTGETLHFSPGEHNLLQKLVIELFLPRYGYGAEVLYVGDTAKKFLLLQGERLKELMFFEIAHGELPDVIAYSAERNWLYLIEAVHSGGPISPERLHELKGLTANCSAEIVYITAFLDKETFRTWMPKIAWETEVWIAENPDHLVHFNGDKFLGPY